MALRRYSIGMAASRPDLRRHCRFIDPSLANGQSVLILTKEDGLPGRIMNWNFNVQRELPFGLLADVAYTGMYSVHLNTLTPFNQVNPSQLKLGDLLPLNITDPRVTAAGYTKPFPSFTGTLAQALRPYPQYLNITHTYLGNGSSQLQRAADQAGAAIQVALGAGGLHMGKGVDAGRTGDADRQRHCGAGPVQPGRSSEACSGSTLPHTFNLIYTWDLPFGRKQGKLVRMLAGGWTIAGLQQYRSGTLLQPTFPNTWRHICSIRRCA